MLLKRLNIINWLKKVSAIKATTDTSDLVKITDHNTNIGGTEKKILDHDHSKYIATQEFNQLMADSFAARLAEAKLATVDDIVDLVKKTNFDNKIKNINKKLL